MKEEVLKAYYRLYTEEWTLFKKYALELTKDTFDCDDFWDAAILEADALAGRYKGTPMEKPAVKLTVTTIVTLQYAAEDAAKAGKGDDDGISRKLGLG